MKVIQKGKNECQNESDAMIELNLLTVLGIVFVVLKLCGVIDWSWWWVVSPFLINLVF